MFPFELLLYLILVHQTIAAPHVYCLWGKLDATPQTGYPVNGEYEVDEIYNGKSYYTMTPSLDLTNCNLMPNYYSMYFNQLSKWTVVQEKKFDASMDVYTCTDAISTHNFPNACTDWDGDKKAYVSAGNCPVWPCTMLRISSIQTSPCTQYFTKFDGYNNVYIGEDPTYYLWFHAPTFRWMCTQNVYQDRCYVLFGDDDVVTQPAQNWYQFTTTNQQWTWTTNHGDFTVECVIGTPTPTTTTTTTLAPTTTITTTPAPTAEPSIFPTSFEFKALIYEITVEFYANPDEDLILIAVTTTYPGSDVISVEIDDVSVIIQLSITSNTDLSSDEIQQTLLDELEDEQDIKNINVVQVNDDNGKQNEKQSVLWIILIIIGVIVVLVMSFIICFVCYRRKRKINHEPTTENIEMKISDPADHSTINSGRKHEMITTQGEDDVIEAISSAVKNVEGNVAIVDQIVSGETSGRWYSPDKQKDDDIYSDEINGVEPIIPKNDKWKHAYFFEKTPQQEQSTQNDNNNQQSVTIGNELSE